MVFEDVCDSPTSKDSLTDAVSMIFFLDISFYIAIELIVTATTLFSDDCAHMVSPLLNTNFSVSNTKVSFFDSGNFFIICVTGPSVCPDGTAYTSTVQSVVSEILQKNIDDIACSPADKNTCTGDDDVINEFDSIINLKK